VTVLARGALPATALVAIAGGLLLSPGAPDLSIVPAIFVVALAQLLRLRFRLGAGVVYVAWGEAALIIGLFLVPAGWLPLAFALGTAIGIVLRALIDRQLPEATLPQVVASLTVAAAAAAAISRAVADPYGGPVTAAVVVSLVVGAVGYLLVAVTLASVLAAMRERLSVLQLMLRTGRSKLLLFGGNVVAGVVVVILADADWRWLLVLPLVLVLLHSTYASRLRLSEHRHMWSAFAEAARSLNQPDEAATAVAGVRGALEVFAVGRAEVELPGGPDGVRRWVADHHGEVRRQPPRMEGDPAGTVVPLVVAGDRIGTLRLHFPRTAGLGNSDQAALQAYADALAAALHDTVTHSELRQLLARSAHDAQHDPLTGLLNRVTLLTQGETAVQLVPHARPVALLLVDIDHFREINDTLGHAAGDEVLAATAARLRDAAGPAELVARLGGDEFALLVPDAPGGPGEALPRIVRRGEELAALLAAPANIRGMSLSIEVSVGAVMAPAGTAEVSELLRRADAALYEAKHGNEVVGWYDIDRDSGGTDRPALLAELRSALDSDELILVLQPVVGLDDGAPIGVEALVRWRHPRRGVLAPADFIRVVENSDLLGAFTGYVVDAALSCAARLAASGTPVPVAVNLSARSLLDPELASTIGAMLTRHRVPGRRLVLEITETVMTRELPGIDETLASLRALGVRLAVDDFGTGYASLTFLTRVPLDEVKVDGTLVAQMAESAEAAAIVRTTVELGRDLGLQVVAEGVETAAQREMLVRLGCPAGQGFHFAEPVPADRICGALREMAASAGKARVIRMRPAGVEPAGYERVGE
jgi:diguanylate cyclase